MFVNILPCNPGNLKQLSKIPAKKSKTINTGKIEEPEQSKKILEARYRCLPYKGY